MTNATDPDLIARVNVAVFRPKLLRMEVVLGPVNRFRRKNANLADR